MQLHSLWYAFGDSVGFALIEAPNNTTKGGVAIAAASSGVFRRFETHALMTQAELLEALGKAAQVSHVAPGAAVRA